MMPADDRIQAVTEFGFTERQARFLVLVMCHAGVCVPRQYARFAGVAQGAKCNAFFDKLVRRGYAHAVECLHNRAGFTMSSPNRCTTSSAKPAAGIADQCRRASQLSG